VRAERFSATRFSATRFSARRFSATTARIAAALPFGLSRVVTGQLLGYLAINGLTFGVDLGCLTLFRSGLRWPLPLAVTGGYVIALALSFTLNRTLNFRSHGAVGPQLTVYAAVVTVNFLAIILGITTGLAALGLEYQLARLAASACETVYMYSAMRWLVFRDAGSGCLDASADPVPLLTGPRHEDDAARQCTS
jgi:putative flippase GtrA